MVGAFVAIACQPDAATPAPTEAPAAATEAPAAATEAPAAATEAPEASAAAAAVSVEVSGLADGDVVTANQLDLAVSPIGYEFNPAGIGKEPADAPSHYHVVLDGALINAFAMPNAVISLQNVAPGDHNVTVLPATNSHGGITDGATSIDFTYEPESALPEITAAADVGEPTISIVSPAAGETVSGKVEVVVDTTDFTLSSDLFGKADLDGFGHWHAFIDEPAMPHLVGMSGADEMTIMVDGVEPGPHTIFAVLVDNLHAPFDPPIVAKVEVEVAGPPSVEVTGLSDGEVVTSNEMDLAVTPVGFELRPDDLGKAPADEVSHYHVVLDGGIINAFTTPNAAITLQNVTPGEHELVVAPAHNDHSMVMEGATTINFEYKPDSPLPEITAVPNAADLDPAISIVSPTAGETVSGDFDVVVEVTDFNLSAPLFGKTDLDGFGHWHAFIDEPAKPHMLRMSGADTLTVSTAGLEPGPHTIFAVLVDNLHAPSDPPIAAKVEIEVADDGSATATGDDEAVAVSLQEWALDPADVTLAAGTYTFEATNDGTIDHALKIEGEGIEVQTPDTFYPPGDTESFTVDLAPGTYQIFCPVAGHKEAGMVATVTVTA